MKADLLGKANYHHEQWVMAIKQRDYLQDENDHLRAENLEQARLLGMSGEQELTLRAKLEAHEKKSAKLRIELSRLRDQGALVIRLEAEVENLRAELENAKREWLNKPLHESEQDLAVERTKRIALERENQKLRAENETLREHKRLLFEDNGRLLAEKESGQWDANCKEIEKLLAEADRMQAQIQFTSAERAKLEDENEKLKAECGGYTDKRGWGHPALVRQLVEERDKLKAEVEGTLNHLRILKSTCKCDRGVAVYPANKEKLYYCQAGEGGKQVACEGSSFTGIACSSVCSFCAEKSEKQGGRS